MEHVPRWRKRVHTWVCVGNLKEKRPVGSPQRIWDDNIKKAAIQVTQYWDGYEILD